MRCKRPFEQSIAIVRRLLGFSFLATMVLPGCSSPSADDTRMEEPARPVKAMVLEATDVRKIREFPG
ncbi:MAG: hypothetical protein PVG49_07410, partial [Desulfobacteraceae bacterium]